MKPLSDPVSQGTLYCMLAPIAYTAYNLCLRGVSDKHDSAWITCVQASVGVVVFGAYLAWQAAHGRRSLPPWMELLSLIAIGIITQVGGAMMVWAMSVVGVGITATVQMGVMLAVTAILGRIILGEPVSWPQAAAIALIVVAVVFFSTASQSANEVSVGEAALDASLSVDNVAGASISFHQKDAARVRALLGIAAAVLAGAAFAVLVVGVRKTVTSATSPQAVVFLISVAGVVFLGPWCVFRLGLETLVQTPSRHLGVMLTAGAMNVIGFFLLTKSLQLITAVRVNVINNALTMTLTEIAGIFLFAELWNRDVLLGIALSIGGVLLISLVGSADRNLAPASQAWNE